MHALHNHAIITPIVTGGVIMVFRFFLLFLGFGLAVAGGVTMILYLNLIPLGNSYSEYALFIAKRPECYLFVVGLIFVSISMLWPSRKNQGRE